MKKIILLALALFSLTALIVFAATTKPLYTCEDGDTILIDHPLDMYNTNESCALFYKDKTSKSYKECVQKIKESDEELKSLYNSGKCKKSGYYIEVKTPKEACGFKYDLNGTRVTGNGYIKYASDGSITAFGGATTFGNTSKTASGNTLNQCFMNAAKILKAKYPHIKGDPKYGFEAEPKSTDPFDDFDSDNQNSMKLETYSNAPLNLNSSPAKVAPSGGKTQKPSLNGPSKPSYQKPVQQKPNTLYECSGTVNGTVLKCYNYDPKNSAHNNKNCLMLYNQGKCLALKIKTYQYGNCSCSCPYIYQYGKIKYRDNGCRNNINEKNANQCGECITKLKNTFK